MTPEPANPLALVTTRIPAPPTAEHYGLMARRMELLIQRLDLLVKPLAEVRP